MWIENAPQRKFSQRKKQANKLSLVFLFLLSINVTIPSEDDRLDTQYK